MAIFDRFRRKEQSVLPDEVKQYYQSEHRQKTGVAVLLGIVALVITVLIAAGLFYGGRYVYRQINKDDNQTAQQEQQEQNNQPEEGATPAETPSEGDNPESTPSNPETTDGSNGQPATPSSGDNTPALGDTPLPRTGDPGM